MERKKVLILFGGCSPEYPISLQSAYSVIENMDQNQYEPILMGITREGEWFRFYGDIGQIPENKWMNPSYCVKAMLSPDRKIHGILEFLNGKVIETRIDIVFPVLHGKNGEDGTIQGLAELAGIPVVGCGLLCSAICMDKQIAHHLVEMEGISVPKGIVFNRDEKEIEKKTEGLSYPLFVKPLKAGSSFGISKVTQKEELREAVNRALEHDNWVVIEETVDGFEVGCALLGEQEPIIGEVDEIELSEGFFDYTEKYTLKRSRIHMPARIDADTTKRVKQTAKKIYEILGCRGFARVDMFLTPDLEIVFNEVNTIPGFTAHSRYPSMLKGIGIPFPEIVNRLIDMAQ